MSKFHASIRDLLEDVHAFLTKSIQNEILSSSSLTHKERLLSRLKCLQNDYPQLLLQFHETEVKTDSKRCSTSSPLPYVDMNGGSPYKIPFFTPNADKENSDVCGPTERYDSLENQSTTGSEEYGSDDGQCSNNYIVGELGVPCEVVFGENSNHNEVEKPMYSENGPIVLYLLKEVKNGIIETSASQDDLTEFATVENNVLLGNTLVQHSKAEEAQEDQQKTLEKKKNGLKRKRNPSQWKENVRKAKRARGEEYISKNGKLIKAKVLEEPCKCKRKCYSKITTEERQIIHNEFYKLTQDGKNQLIANNIEEIKTRRKQSSKKDAESKRVFTRKYFLDGNETKIEVCLKMFLRTLCISEKKVAVVAKKKRESRLGIVQ